MKGNINQKNFVFHEIKVIKEKKKIKPEPCEIIEDLTKIHEIKDIKNYGQNNKNNNYERRIRPGKHDSNYEINQNQDIYVNQNQYINNIHEINNEEYGQVSYDFVNVPFLSEDNKVNNNIIGKEEDIEYDEIYEGKNEDNEDDNSKLIETIFLQIKYGNIDNDNLKNILRGLNEDDKNEIIEGIKIKIENKEQENILNNLLEKLL